MKGPTDARKRILLHFLLGIALPALLLAYLAFRGIQNDRALVERQRLNEQRRTAELIGEAVDEAVGDVERVFYGAIAAQASSGGSLLRVLDSVRSEFPLVEELFFLDETGTLRLPVARLLFSQEPPARPSLPTPVAEVSSEISLAERYEFRERRYSQAIDAYQRALARAPDEETKGEMLAAMARVQKKSDQMAVAIQSYRRLAQEFGHVQAASGISLGGAARLELGNLLLETGDTLGALEASVDLYRRLLNGEWALTEPHFEFLVGQARQSLTDVATAARGTSPQQAYRDTLAFLGVEEERRRAQTRKLLVFREQAAAALVARIDRQPEEPPTDSRRFALDIGGDTFLASLLDAGAGPADRGGAASGRWGILLNAELLESHVLMPVIRRHAASQEFLWVLRGGVDEVLRTSDEQPSGLPSLRADLPGSFPPWTLEFYQPTTRLVETLLTSRRGVYFYAFLLLAGILAFGLTFTIRTVSQQLQLARMQSDFVSTISHEFKSPLTAIRQLAEMLKERRVRSEERRQRYYDVLLEQSERLSLLIDNVLDFARMEEGVAELDLETVDVRRLVEEIASDAEHRVRHEGFSIRAEIDDALPPLLADAGAIGQATRNLIDNAIKYSGDSREVIVRGYPENRHVVIAVCDFGIGIQKNELERVFERFYRGGDPLTRTVKGTGLGLTLVRQIAEAHGGTVEVESEPGRGSTFRLKLPVEGAINAAGTRHPERRERAGRRAGRERAGKRAGNE